MLHALRDRTAANLLVRVCHGICDASSVVPTQSAWHHYGMRSLQLAARAFFEHDSPIASPSVVRQTPTSTSPCEARGQTQPILWSSAASRKVYPSLSGVPCTTASASRAFRSSAVHSAAAAALSEPTEAAQSSDTPDPEDSAVQSRAPMGIPSAPWTPTDQLQKRKTLPKRMGFMLQVSCLQLLA